MRNRDREKLEATMKENHPEHLSKYNHKKEKKERNLGKIETKYKERKKQTRSIE